MKIRMSRTLHISRERMDMKHDVSGGKRGGRRAGVVRKERRKKVDLNEAFRMNAG